MSAGRALIRVGAPAITLVGVVFGVMGTLLICKPYHPFSMTGLARHVFLTLVPMVVKGRIADAYALMQTTSKLSAINEEDKVKSLFGIYLAFVGFVFQSFGAVLWAIDSLIAR